jgi:uncharacterized repeat protein (TIGR03803 family)
MKKSILHLAAAFLLTANCLLPTVSQAQYTKLLDFAGATNGSSPNGSLISDGTFLYGMTYDGGTNNKGTIFKIKLDGTGYVKLHDFGGTGDGAGPYHSLISAGGFLYGTTSDGGANFFGTVFKIEPDGTGYAKILDCTQNGEGNPSCNLIYDGTYLYGTSSTGGTGNYGTVFKIKPDGTGYANLFNFNSTNGSGPSTLISDGTYLYGATGGGGTGGFGTIYKIKLDGTGYVNLLNFTGAAGTANGSQPVGPLLYDGTFLYGSAFSGGTGTGCGPTGCGLIFKIKPDGTGYVKLFDFGNANGIDPNGSLVSDGTYLYGMARDGGTNYRGVIFQIMLNGKDISRCLILEAALTGKARGMV